MLEALLEADYPHDPGQLEIIPINDHSSDNTGEILDEYAARYSWIKPLHRRNGRRGKAAALRAATRLATGEVLIVFDADYLPENPCLNFWLLPLPIRRWER